MTTIVSIRRGIDKASSPLKAALVCEQRQEQQITLALDQNPHDSVLAQMSYTLTAVRESKVIVGLLPPSIGLSDAYAPTSAQPQQSIVPVLFRVDLVGCLLSSLLSDKPPMFVCESGQLTRVSPMASPLVTLCLNGTRPADEPAREETPVVSPGVLTKVLSTDVPAKKLRGRVRAQTLTSRTSSSMPKRKHSLFDPTLTSLQLLRVTRNVIQLTEKKNEQNLDDLLVQWEADLSGRGAIASVTSVSSYEGWQSMDNVYQNMYQNQFNLYQPSPPLNIVSTPLNSSPSPVMPMVSPVQSPKSSTSATSITQFIVGGTTFDVPKGLLSTYKNSYFDRLARDVNASDVYHLNRSPKHFPTIMRLLNPFDIPSEISSEDIENGLMEEIKFYGLPFEYYHVVAQCNYECRCSFCDAIAANLWDTETVITVTRDVHVAHSIAFPYRINRLLSMLEASSLGEKECARMAKSYRDMSDRCKRGETTWRRGFEMLEDPSASDAQLKTQHLCQETVRIYAKLSRTDMVTPPEHASNQRKMEDRLRRIIGEGREERTHSLHPSQKKTVGSFTREDEHPSDVSIVSATPTEAVADLSHEARYLASCAAVNLFTRNEQTIFLPHITTDRDSMLWTIVGVASLVGILLQISRFYNKYKSLSRTIPTFLEPLLPYSLLYQLKILPTGYTKFGDPEFIWKNKYEPYKETGSQVYAVHTPTYSGIFLADPEAIAEVAARRDDFPKPLEQYGILDIYGRSVVTTEGDDWKLHRKIVSPPFSEKNNRLVWNETIKQADMMMNDWDSQAKGKGISKMDANDKLTSTDGTEVQVLADTMKLALHIITAAAFGIPFKWTDSSAPWPNHQLSFYQSLVTLLDRLFSILLIPNFIFQLPINSIRKSKNAYDEFGQYLTDIVTREKERSSEERDEGKENLMAALIRMAEGNLTDREITGNAFIFLIAGHETTAHTLMYTFYLLSMHPEVQKKMKEEADRVYGDREPQYEDFNSLVYTNAVAYEVLRLFPPVANIPKFCPREQTLCGGKYIIPANTYVTLNAAGVHYNTDVWGPDAAEFNPSRFDPRENGKKPVKGSFIPFSEGARSCLGKKFANVEMVAALSNVLRRYTIHLPEGYDEARMKRELSDSHSVITLQPKKSIPVIVKKRN
ncbi:putative P450 monooxygenase [Planoprotostelium fungivorum]|uniref:Putative P450 monooxygenase n=1 Tax=Planoprotostelium fungivorum TaxID=1890364 RepID=A0A2P6NAM1_9EUKA|nr:putative P450 monooxygenase [Planoprotostelium fungivorum]